MIKAEANFEATIINIPKQIPQKDLVQLMPLRRLTNYEKRFERQKLVHTDEAPTLVTQSNGSVKFISSFPTSLDHLHPNSYHHLHSLLFQGLTCLTLFLIPNLLS